MLQAWAHLARKGSWEPVHLRAVPKTAASGATLIGACSATCPWSTLYVHRLVFFWPALPAPALSCQSGSSRRVVSCQKMTQGIGLGMGKRWLQAAEPHHLNSTTCLNIRKAQTLAARRAAVSNPVCAHSSLAATGRRARVPPHTVNFSFNACLLPFCVDNRFGSRTSS